MRFGAFMKKERETVGLSIYRMAKLTGISEPQLSNYEAGRSEATVEKAERICLALGCEFVIGSSGITQEDYEENGGSGREVKA